MTLFLIWLIGGILYTILVAYLIKNEVIDNEWLSSCPIWFVVLPCGFLLICISLLVFIFTAPFIFIASLILKKPFSEIII
jgi:hypothetical protein